MNTPHRQMHEWSRHPPRGQCAWIRPKAKTGVYLADESSTAARAPTDTWRTDAHGPLQCAWRSARWRYKYSLCACVHPACVVRACVRSHLLAQRWSMDSVGNTTWTTPARAPLNCPVAGACVHCVRVRRSVLDGLPCYPSLRTARSIAAPSRPAAAAAAATATCAILHTHTPTERAWSAGIRIRSGNVCVCVFVCVCACLCVSTRVCVCPLVWKVGGVPWASDETNKFLRARMQLCLRPHHRYPDC